MKFYAWNLKRNIITKTVIDLDNKKIINTSEDKIGMYTFKKFSFYFHTDKQACLRTNCIYLYRIQE